MKDAVSLQAGAGRAVIDIPVLPVDGFTTIHDPLHARVLILDDGATRVVIASVDLTSIFDPTVQRLRAVLAAESAAAEHDILICATHTFSAPHIFPAGQLEPGDRERSARYADAVDDAVRDAARQAVSSLRPARIGGAVGRSDVNVNRDVPTPHGWWLGANEFGPTDRTLSVIRIEDDTARPVGIVFSFPVPPAVMLDSRMPDGGRAVSADLAGAAGVVEEAIPGAVALFLVGAAGDQAPAFRAARPTLDADGTPGTIDLGPAGFDLVGLLASRLGRDAATAAGRVSCAALRSPLRVVRRSVDVPAQVATPLERLRPRTTAGFVADGVASAPVAAVAIDDIVIVGTPAELTTVSAGQVRAGSPFAVTIVATMVDGAAKYMADRSAYDRITYGAMNSRYGCGAAEVLVAEAGRLLGEVAVREGL